MNKLKVLSISLIVVVFAAILTLFLNTNGPKEPKKSEIGTAVNQAQYIYNLRKEQGTDFSKGPCLSNALLDDWVLDIAHNPRQSIDDFAENQCPAFLEGRAKHFVELDPDGNLIRAR